MDHQYWRLRVYHIIISINIIIDCQKKKNSLNTYKANNKILIIHPIWNEIKMNEKYDLILFFYIRRLKAQQRAVDPNGLD